MREEIRNFYERNYTIISNFSYLSILQALSLLVPIIIYPLLINKIGTNNFGSIIYAQAIIAYITIFVGFGFNISGVKEVSIHRNDKEKIIQIVNSIQFSKLIILIISFILFMIITAFIPYLQENRNLFIYSFWFAILDIVFPIWYFQGIERMKYITFLSLISKVIFLILIVLFIRVEEDYIKVPIFQGIGVFFVGVFSFYIIVFKHKVKITLPLKGELIHQIKAALPIFVSNISIQLYANSNRILVGNFLGMNEVTYYDVSEKIINLLKMPQSIITQTLFPKIALEKNAVIVKNMAKYSILLAVFLTYITYFFTPQVLRLIGGENVVQATSAMRLLLITVPIVVLSNIFGIQLLIAFGYTKIFTKVIVSSFLFYLGFSVIMYYTIGFNLNKIILTTVFTEIFVTLLMFIYCKKIKLW